MQRSAETIRPFGHGVLADGRLGADGIEAMHGTREEVAFGADCGTVKGVGPDQRGIARRIDLSDAGIGGGKGMPIGFEVGVHVFGVTVKRVAIVFPEIA